ncbi:MAG TPA: hypothetical protein IAA05_04185 [Candidatus Blautia excrementipullorum]|nr:hypothetical protein [Candidatus Blautia excrementipullorum]
MRLTRKNPGSGGYRIPMCTQKTLRLEWQQSDLAVYGEVADKLGRYEDLGSPEELEELIKKNKK